MREAHPAQQNAREREATARQLSTPLESRGQVAHRTRAGPRNERRTPCGARTYSARPATREPTEDTFSRHSATLNRRNGRPPQHWEGDRWPLGPYQLESPDCRSRVQRRPLRRACPRCRHRVGRPRCARQRSAGPSTPRSRCGARWPRGAGGRARRGVRGGQQACTRRRRLPVGGWCCGCRG